MIPFHAKDYSGQSYATCFQALEMPERGQFTLATIVWFEGIISIAFCIDSRAVEVKCQSSDWNACWQRAEKTLSNILMD